MTLAMTSVFETGTLPLCQPSILDVTVFSAAVSLQMLSKLFIWTVDIHLPTTHPPARTNDPMDLNSEHSIVRLFVSFDNLMHSACIRCCSSYRVPCRSCRPRSSELCSRHKPCGCTLCNTNARTTYYRLDICRYSSPTFLRSFTM